jgi:acyl transferase domain-containing protein
MLAVRANLQKVETTLLAHESLDCCDVAGIATQSTTILAGDLSGIQAAEEILRGDGLGTKAIEIPYGYHSRHIRAAADLMSSRKADVALRFGRSEETQSSTSLQGGVMISTVTGSPVTKEGVLGLDYWVSASLLFS